MAMFTVFQASGLSEQRLASFTLVFRLSWFFAATHLANICVLGFRLLYQSSMLFQLWAC